MKLKKAIKLYDEGHVTLEGVYDSCETDLEFYNFLKYHRELDEDEVKEEMHSVTCADDAYYNALAMSDNYNEDEENEENVYLNDVPINHGLAVVVQKKSITKLKEILESMNKEPVAFEEYIPEIEHLIKKLASEDYTSLSKDWR